MSLRRAGAGPLPDTGRPSLSARRTLAVGPTFLMCAPEHFAVIYSINPWMKPHRWAANDRQLAGRQWQHLRDTLRGLGATIELLAPVPGLPDLVFTANAAVVFNGTALLSRFRHSERAGE